MVFYLHSKLMIQWKNEYVFKEIVIAIPVSILKIF